MLTSLVRHNAAMIWGGPGEGKTMIAMAAAERRRKQEPELSAFELDMQGKCLFGMFSAPHHVAMMFSWR